MTQLAPTSIRHPEVAERSEALEDTAAQPPSVPLVDGISPAARGSIATAARNARASPLKHDSEIWWLLVPYNVSTCSVTPAFIANAWNHSCTSSVSNVADLVAAERGLEHQKRPPRNIDRDARQRFVHRHVHVGITRNALHVAERLLDRLTERDADVLGGVVVVDVQVALRLDGDVDRAWRASRSSMWSKKPMPVATLDAPVPSRFTSTDDVGLLGLPRHGGGSHGQSSRISRAF